MTNSFSYIMPWHIWAFLLVATLAPLEGAFPFLAGTLPSPTEFAPYCFYPMTIFVTMLVAVIFGIGRRFEDMEGNPVREPVTK